MWWRVKPGTNESPSSSSSVSPLRLRAKNVEPRRVHEAFLQARVVGQGLAFGKVARVGVASVGRTAGVQVAMTSTGLTAMIVEMYGLPSCSSRSAQLVKPQGVAGPQRWEFSYGVDAIPMSRFLREQRRSLPGHLRLLFWLFSS